MLKLNRKIKAENEVILTELENKDAVVLNLTTKMYYTLNESGLRIWQMAENDLTLEEISEKLQEEFDVTPEKAKESVINLITELISEKLVRVVDE
jgi:hypothetical protein